MKTLFKLLKKAESSPLQLFILNLFLWRIIPFNAPHRFKITEIKADSLKIKMPYIRKNLNHIKGLHACGLATLCEYVCGLQLIKLSGPSPYRIILKSLHLDYHYQGKKSALAEFSLNLDWFHQNIALPLENEEAILRTFEIRVYDEDHQLLCTGKPEWQIKPWNKVKTKI